jgi:hypothetical protein
MTPEKLYEIFLTPARPGVRAAYNLPIIFSFLR